MTEPTSRRAGQRGHAAGSGEQAELGPALYAGDEVGLLAGSGGVATLARAT